MNFEFFFFQNVRNKQYTLLEKIQKKYCNSKSSEFLNFFSKTYEKFSIFYWNKQNLFNFQKNLQNIQYFLFKNFKYSQLQAKNTGNSAKN
jgi:hypothetical protein